LRVTNSGNIIQNKSVKNNNDRVLKFPREYIISAAISISGGVEAATIATKTY